MRGASTILINTPEIELWPGGLLRARSNRDARALSRASTVLRRKCDGRYLAVMSPEGLLPLVPQLMREPGIGPALAALDVPMQARVGTLRRAQQGRTNLGALPLDRLLERLQLLGLDDSYGERSGLPLVAEPALLDFAGRDRFRRPLWLHPQAARAWTHLRDAAQRDDVVFDAISGYRSHDYQLGIFQRKRARGQSVEEILTVNAAPGYSEHHSGRALDIGSPDEPPAEESFEHTDAFAWLTANAGGHGFVMSYPRDNAHGIVYEPWHWRHGNPE